MWPPDALRTRTSPKPPVSPLQPKRYFACRGRGPGKERGDEGVRVDSQFAARAVQAKRMSDEKTSALECRNNFITTTRECRAYPAEGREPITAWPALWREWSQPPARS